MADERAHNNQPSSRHSENQMRSRQIAPELMSINPTKACSTGNIFIGRRLVVDLGHGA